MNNNKLIKKNISFITSITLIFSLIGPWIGLVEGANASFLPGGSVSTVNPTTGFPDYYQDQNGLKLELMEAADAFGISDPVDPLNPFSQQIGFNAEGFWWSADASINNGTQTALLVLALEAAFAGEAAVDGEQSSFGRIRYRIDGLIPGESYTIRHPYGVATEIADGAGVINVTDDIGCFAVAGLTTCDPAKVGTGVPPLASAGGFALALSSGIGPFLMWDTFNIDPALTDPLLKNIQPAYSGRSYLGNPLFEHTITGSPVSQNFFEVTGSGLTDFSTNLFVVTGRLFAPLVQLNSTSFTSGDIVNNTGSLEFNFTVNDSGVGSFIGDPSCSNLASFPVIAGTQTGQINPTVNGSFNCNFIVTNAQGNASNPVAIPPFTFDNVAPASPVITTTNITTSGSTVTIAGTAEADSMIEILSGATVVGTGIATGGNFSISSVPIVEGANNLTATATDAAGNTSAPSAQAVTVTVDTVAPVTPVITTTGITVNTTTINIAGTAESGSTVQIFNGVNLLVSGTADIGGNFNISTPLDADGTFSITATSTDAAGNTSGSSNTVSVVRDTVNPIGTVAFVSGTLTNQTGTTVNLTSTKTGTFSTSGAGMVGTVTGSLVADVSALIDLVLTTGDGVKNISVIYADTVGNTSTQTASITLDQTAPAAPVITTTNITTSGSTVTIAGTAEANSVITILNGVNVVGTGIATGGNFSIASVPVVEGANNLSATATDAAGNTSTTSVQAVTVTVDTTAPSAPVITTTVTTVNTATVNIEGTAESGSTVKIFNGVNLLATGTASVGGTFNISTPLAADGTFSLTAKSTDIAGNTSSVSNAVSVIKDTVLPVISNVRVQNVTQNGADVLFQFTDSHFTNGTGTGTVTLGTGGSFTNVSTNPISVTLGTPNSASASISALVPLTQYGFKVNVSDDAGNTSTFTGSFVTASTPVTLGGTVTQTGITTLTGSALGVGGTLILSGTTLTVTSDTVNVLNAIEGALTLSGITSISVGGSTWNGIILPPSLINAGDDNEATSSELSTLVSTNFGPGLSSTVLETIKVGGEDNVSLIADDGNFHVQFVVPSSSSGTVLNLFRSTNGSTWELNSPDTTCTLDADKICAFNTNHLSYFAPTVIVDNIPTTLSFTALTSRPLSAVETSNSLTVSGMGTGVSGNVVVANGSMSVNGGAFASTGTITNGDSVQLKLTNSASNSTLVTATMSIDSTVVGTFSSTTLASSSGSSGGSSGGGGGSAGGGGGGGIMKDGCLTGDKSPSMYDGKCKAEDTTSTGTTLLASSSGEDRGKIPEFFEDGISMSDIFEDISNSFENEVLFETLSLNSNEGPGNFKDIDNSFAKDYILELANKGIIQGFDDGSFKPDNSITRAEYLSIVMKTLGIPVDTSLTETTFTDIPNGGSWMIKYLEKAKSYGIRGQVINGKSVFRPNDPITRAEAMSILLNIAEIETSSKTTTDFTDIPTMWIKYVEKAKELNIISGQVINGKLRFRPNDSLTRAEAVKIIKKGTDSVSLKTSIGTPTPETHNVDILATGVSPATITINKGDTIIFTNKDSSSHWIASAMHPTHTVYPGSGIEKCGTSEESKIFDMCGGIGEDETYTFTFNEVGEWKYHDHVNATKSEFYGTIIVKEE